MQENLSLPHAFSFLSTFRLPEKICEAILPYGIGTGGTGHV